MFDIGGEAVVWLLFLVCFFFLSLFVFLFLSFFVLGVYQQGAFVLVHRHWRIGPLPKCSIT